MRLGTRQVALESVWEVTLLEILFTFDLVWVPGFGMAPQTTLICFSVVSLSVSPWNSIRV